MSAVVNAGPLIALGKLGLLHLLHRLFGPVLVPAAVCREVVVRGIEIGQPDAYAVRFAIARAELLVVDVRLDVASDLDPDGKLDPGELEAIELARREEADLVLLDDQIAREFAHRLGLQVKGTLGTIISAFRNGLLQASEVELVFQAILDRKDIWIADDLVRSVRDKWRREIHERVSMSEVDEPSPRQQE